MSFRSHRANILSQIKTAPSLSCSFSCLSLLRALNVELKHLYSSRPALELGRWKLSLLNTFQVFHTHICIQQTLKINASNNKTQNNDAVITNCNLWPAGSVLSALKNINVEQPSLNRWVGWMISLLLRSPAHLMLTHRVNEEHLLPGYRPVCPFNSVGGRRRKSLRHFRGDYSHSFLWSMKLWFTWLASASIWCY